MRWKVESKYYHDSDVVESELSLASPGEQPREEIKREFVLFVDIFPSKEIAQLYYQHTKLRVN